MAVGGSLPKCGARLVVIRRGGVGRSLAVTRVMHGVGEPCGTCVARGRREGRWRNKAVSRHTEATRRRLRRLWPHAPEVWLSRGHRRHRSTCGVSLWGRRLRLPASVGAQPSDNDASATQAKARERGASCRCPERVLGADGVVDGHRTFELTCTVCAVGGHEGGVIFDPRNNLPRALNLHNRRA